MPSSAQLLRMSEAKILSSALALSGGVMLYVSYVEIFPKALKAIAAELPEGEALTLTTFMFFAGMGFVALLEWIVHLLRSYLQRGGDGDDSHGDLHSLPLPQVADKHESDTRQVQVTVHGPTAAAPAASADESVNKAQLMRTALLTALAIGLHNFPEGLATFLATLADPALGVALAVAIAIHNVPEGVAVAMPIYYSTGSKWKGFMWASLSGISEPIGGCLGACVPAVRVGPLPSADQAPGAQAGSFSAMCSRTWASELFSRWWAA